MTAAAIPPQPGFASASPDSSPVNGGAKNSFLHRLRGRWPGVAQRAKPGRRGDRDHGRNSFTAPRNDGLDVLRFFVLILLALCGAISSHAHTRSQTSAILTADPSGVRLTVAIEAREVTRATALPGLALPLPQAMRLHFLKEVQISADGVPCPATARAPSFAATMRMEIDYACPPGWRDLNLTYNAFFDVARGHIAIVHAEIDGQPRGEAVLSKLVRDLAIPRTGEATEAHRDGFFAFLDMGVLHILEGIDHLCFVIGLLLITRSFGTAAITLTGFTLGHSVTLALGALDVVRVSAPVVETLIAVTILAVALEALRAQGATSRAVEWAMLCVLAFAAASLAIAGAPVWLILATIALILGAGFSAGADTTWRKPFAFAAGFGTIHGLAFAETLREALTPGGGLLWALLGFNLGVEVGQLLVAAVAAGAFTLWQARHSASAAAGAYAMACLLLLGGATWFAARLPFA
jgi:hypothetical protein